MQPGSQRGASIIELLVGTGILSIVMVAVSGMLVENGRVNKREHLRAEAQANARNTVARAVSILRSAGWDPGDNGIPTVALDPDTTDAISEIEAFIDHDGDGITAGTDFEQIRIRHLGDRVEWRIDGTGPFQVMSTNITNDADGDGVVEPMFTPDSTTNPTRILVQVTAASSAPDPDTGQPLRYTMTSEVVLRKRL